MNLASQWVLWQNNNDESNAKSWGDDLMVVGEVSTIPEFLYLCDEISNVGVGKLCTMNLFKKGIKPMWEDEGNIEGGRIIMDVPVVGKDSIDELWKRTMAFCVSNTVDNICGCVLSEKQSFYKVAIWFGKDYNQDSIKDMWQEALGGGKLSIYSFLHKKSLDSNKGKKKWGGRR
ncbi:eukaryotic translation initiation factor 4E [Encephalitozoon intestinalis ATCC 50506]|uniref:Eukaryotic translation initiation factor 4E n=1 Tax=Encephalitozoon intestinalis (strain ATCC 50506) TaxID=876142 RepID=E0S8M5_ENCIT|nr:eukaryotic translation initiation factor 4E [Encephalitozoon intestinalis ATCC 50506]ADM12019.1 eukaryotic translation initiation factor 4E [Encephalitozoon intestinalis ATCC 50506]UTX45807.1 eukaryotic translation initiation factor 4E [Encephalitozoon intestinalis]